MGVPQSISPDVLIVGAGPTGLLLANQLARRGLRPLLIDRNPGPALQTRALGVQARTLEIYSYLGLAERAIALGHRASAANMWVDSHVAARIPLGDIGRDLSPYPFLLILGQDDNERLLREALVTHGLDVQWNIRLVGLVQHADHVTATLERTDVGGGAGGSARTTTEEVHARYVAGCDGAHSAVRELCGIDFIGAPYEHVFFVADTRATGPMVPGELNIYLWPDGFHLFFPMRGDEHWRVVGIVPPELRGRDDLRFEDVLSSLHSEAGGPAARLAFQQCTWFSTYRIHHRRAARFRDRRCFLLGDAAHIHSPVGAQGMNTGLQDAYNLGWKLALALSGRLGGGDSGGSYAADDALLDTYAAEREPVADRLLRTTDQAFRVVVSSRGLAGLLRTRVAPRAAALAMRSEHVRRLAFRTISQIGIRYPHSPLSQGASRAGRIGDGDGGGDGGGDGDGRGRGARGGPAPGDRFPWLKLVFTASQPPDDLFARLDDTRFTLLVFGQPATLAAAGMADLLAVEVVPDDPANARELTRARIPRPSFYLLRPDGHVGLAGAWLDEAAVLGYLRQTIGLRD